MKKIILVFLFLAFITIKGQSQSYFVSIPTNAFIKESKNQDYKNYLWKLSREKGLDPKITFKQIKFESNFNPNARGRSGERGIGQFMPTTAKRLGLNNPFDPYQAIETYTNYMSFLVSKYGTHEHALAAYNCGEGTVDRAIKRKDWMNRIPKSTRGYVISIVSLDKSPTVKRVAVSKRNNWTYNDVNKVNVKK